MSKNDVLDVVRKKMLDFLEAGKNFSKWSKERPTDWRPTSVINPNSDLDLTFTNKTCWGFIKELLQNKHPIEVTTLEKPPGEKGYVMLFETESGSSDIYIKLQIVKGHLMGRSFHYSDRSK